MRKILLMSGALIAIVNSPNLANAAACLTSDVTLKIGSTNYIASLCGNNLNQGGGPITETGSVNAVLTGAGSANAPFSLLASSDGTSDTLQGIKYSVTANATADTWSVMWVDTNGSAPLNLPITIDFAVALFGGNAGSAYEFDNVLLPESPNTGSGTFDVTFTNNGGNNPTLSHLVLDGSHAAAVVPPRIPEPASLAVLGLGLVALGFTRRRRYQTV